MHGRCRLLKGGSTHRLISLLEVLAQWHQSLYENSYSENHGSVLRHRRHRSESKRRGPIGRGEDRMEVAAQDGEQIQIKEEFREGNLNRQTTPPEAQK